MLRLDQISWICTTQESITCFGIGETAAIMAAAAAEAAASAAAAAASFIGTALVGTAATAATATTAAVGATSGLIGTAGAVTFGGVVQAGLAGISLASTAMSAMSASQQGDEAEQVAQYKAQLAQQDANNAAATGERNMIAQEKQNAINQSNAVAASAGSGTAGSTTEFTNLDLIADQGNYKAMTAMYDGESKAQAYGNSAAADIFQGQISDNADQTKAITDAINGGVSLLSKYGPSVSAAPAKTTATVASPTQGN